MCPLEVFRSKAETGQSKANVRSVGNSMSNGLNESPGTAQRTTFCQALDRPTRKREGVPF